MASNDILKNLKERDVKAGRGYINDIGEYVSYEKEGEDSSRDEGAAYMPPGGTAAKSQARIDKKNSFKYKMAQKATADAAKAGRQTKDIGADRSQARQGLGRGMPDEIERRQKAMRSEYFPQTGTRSDEEKGFFSGMYDKTVGEYQRGQVEKERLKEETKAAMAAEPDPIVKKEIARKGHAEYMKIAATEGQGERGRETAGREALVAQRVREAQQEQANKDARVKGYKDFSDEASLNAQERARRGEGGLIQQGMTGGSLEDLAGEGSAALTEMEEKEQRKYGGVGREMLEERHQREKGLMNIGSLPPSERAKLEDPEAAGTKIAQNPSRHDDYIKEIAGDPDAPGLKEWGASVNQESIEGDMEAGMKQDEEERAVNEEFTQDQARDAISTLDPDEGDEVVKQIEEAKGKGSAEALEAKEALRDKDGQPRYVRYEGSGLVIDMAVLGKDIDRNHFFKNVLPNTPKGNRAALMAAQGYFREEDLSITQKKSAKEIKELEILNLQANKLKLDAEKLRTSVPAGKKMQYDQIMTGFRQATKDKDWDSASMYASELRGIGLPLKDFDPIALEAASNERLLGKEPHMLNIAKKHGIMVGGKPSLSPFYKQQGALSLKLNFLGKDAGSSGGSFDLEEKIHTGSKITFGEILNNNGIETWDKVSARINKGGNDSTSKAIAKAMGLENLEGVSREAYLHYAKSKVHDVISRSVWGPAYDEIKQGGLQSRTQKEKEAQDNFDPTKETNPESSSISDEYKPTDWVKKQGTTASRAAAKVKAAEKVKAGKAKAYEDEISADNRQKQQGRESVQKTNKEKKVEYMKEGKERLAALVKGKMIKNQKKAIVGHPKFNSTEDAIKFYKNDPKGKKLLKNMSLAFRHFMKQQ